LETSIFKPPEAVGATAVQAGVKLSKGPQPGSGPEASRPLRRPDQKVTVAIQARAGGSPQKQRRPASSDPACFARRGPGAAAAVRETSLKASLPGKLLLRFRLAFLDRRRHLHRVWSVAPPGGGWVVRKVLSEHRGTGRYPAVPPCAPLLGVGAGAAAAARGGGECGWAPRVRHKRPAEGLRAPTLLLLITPADSPSAL